MSFVDVLRTRASDHPDRLALTFLEDGERAERHVTYGELDRRARAIGARLGAGERVLLVFPPGLDYVAGFFACLYAGAIAVPVYPPHNTRAMARFFAVVEDAAPRAILTTRALRGLLEAMAGDRFGGADWVLTDDDATADMVPTSPAPSSVAFLQYTSGSTAAPRGVMVTHGNLAANSEVIRRKFEHDAESRGVIWLPPYHDMGLIGGILQPIWVGFPTVLLSPLAMLERPVRWLEAVSRHRATTSGGPNFAYELAAARVTDTELAALDLSSWEVAFCGSEPVRAETMQRFARRFEPAGFRSGALYPCYGLAEGTLASTGGMKLAGPTVRWFQGHALDQGRAVPGLPGEAARALVSSGPNADDAQRLLIVEPRTAQPLSDGQIGEIWLAGPSVASGYWRRPEETAATFGARLAGGDGPYLRTGDLGFVHAGELFVAGRLKDLIIVRGRKLHPPDLEATAEAAHPALRKGCSAAFATDGAGTEGLALVAEVDARKASSLAEVRDAVRGAVAGAHAVALDAVTFIEPRTIPKTTSGKVQRGQCRAALAAGELRVLGSWRDPGEAPPAAGAVDSWTQLLVEHLAAWLHVDTAEIDVTRSCTAAGLDSVGAAELASGLGVRAPLALFLDERSLAEVAAELERLARAPRPEAPAVGARSDGHLASRNQEADLRRHAALPSADLIARAGRLRGPLDADAFAHALADVTARHPALRTTLHAGTSGSRSQARVHPTAPPIAPRFVDATGWEDDRVAAWLAEEARRPFRLDALPLLRVTLLRRAADDHVALLTVHHAVADAVSLLVFLRDLGTAYAARAAGNDPALPAAPGFDRFVAWEDAQLAADVDDRLGRGWLDALADLPPPLALAGARPRPASPSLAAGLAPVRVPAACTAALARLAREEQVTLSTALLAAFHAFLRRRSGASDVVVGTTMSLRDEPELAEIMGPIFNYVPVRCRLPGDPSFRQLQRATSVALLGGLRRRAYPFAQITARLGLDEIRHAHPVYQALFTFFGSRQGGLSMGRAGSGRLGPLALETVPLPQRLVPQDLFFSVGESDDGLAGALVYKLDLFDRASGAALADELGALLEAVAREPDAPLSRLSAPTRSGAEDR